MERRMNKQTEKFANVPLHFAERSHEKMQEVLMNPKAEGPKIHYYMIRGDMKNGRGNNITTWEPGTVGGEYIKTYGHYHVGKLDETYTVISGKGMVVLQKLAVDVNEKMIQDVVEEFKIIPVKVGEKVFIPSNCGHLAVNIGSDFFVTEDDSPVNFGKKDEASMPGHADYESVKQMKGFAFYIVENDGKPALIKNRLYKEVKKTDLAGLPIISK
jgi:glucose-6-phosphate isomerase, archaeal